MAFCHVSAQKMDESLSHEDVARAEKDSRHK